MPQEQTAEPYGSPKVASSLATPQWAEAFKAAFKKISPMSLLGLAPAYLYKMYAELPPEIKNRLDQDMQKSWGGAPGSVAGTLWESGQKNPFSGGSDTLQKAVQSLANLGPVPPESKYPSSDETALNAAKQLIAAQQAKGPILSQDPIHGAKAPEVATVPLPSTDQTPGTISAYDRGTGRYWQNYSRNNPTPTNTGTYDPIGGAQVSETAAMPFNIGGRYTKVNQGGSNMGELRNPDTASAYVKANLDRHQTEDLASQQGTAAQALELQQTRNLMGASPQQLAVMQGIAKHGLPRPVEPRETEASKVQANLSAFEYIRDKQARAIVQSKLAQLGAQVSPEKEAELLDHEKQKLAQNPDAELSSLAPRYRPDPYAAFNQTTENP